MRVLVISDTHGELGNVKKLMLRALKLRPDLVIHLGDNYDDANVLMEKFKVMRVPGVYEDAYFSPDVPNRILIDLKGWTTLLVHSLRPHENDQPWDLDPTKLISKGVVDLVLHGHTHVPRVERHEVVLVNPGHLKSEDKRGYPPSFAVLDVIEDELKISIEELNSEKLLAEGRFPKRAVS